MAAACSFFWPLDARAAFEANDSDWQGTSELVGLARSTMGRGRVNVVTELDWSKLSGADALLLLHPESSLDFDQVTAFLGAGGRLAVVDDFGAGSHLLDHFHIHRRAAADSPKLTLRDNPELAIALPVGGDATGTSEGRHPIVVEVDQVVTNHPTALLPDPGVELTPVLEIPSTDDTSALLALVGVIGDARRCGLVPMHDSDAARANERCGRLFAMSDPSVFINLMLRYPGNRALARGLLKYLSENDTWGERNGNLYVLINTFRQTGSVNGSLGPLAWLNRKNEALSSALDEIRSRGLPNGWATVMAGAIALGLALTAARRAGGSASTQVPRFALPVHPVAQGGPVGRAAVLSADTTHRALAVLELRSALLETLGQRLGLGVNAAPHAVLQEIERSRLLSKPASAKLERMLAEMSKAETAIARSQQLHVRETDVRRYHQTVRDLLAELDPGRRGVS